MLENPHIIVKVMPKRIKFFIVKITPSSWPFWPRPIHLAGLDFLAGAPRKHEPFANSSDVKKTETLKTDSQQQGTMYNNVAYFLSIASGFFYNQIPSIPSIPQIIRRSLSHQHLGYFKLYREDYICYQVKAIRP